VCVLRSKSVLRKCLFGSPNSSSAPSHLLCQNIRSTTLISDYKLQSGAVIFTMTETKQEENNQTDINETGNRPVTKEKIRGIMEAASALTALGDEESDNSRPGSPIKEEEAPEAPAGDSGEKEQKEDSPKRFLPDHKKPDAAPTFPEKVSKQRCRPLKGKHQRTVCVQFVLTNSTIDIFVLS
jgi:hypothetical protein